MIAAGLYPHLTQVEFPYAEANARMEWDGVPVSRERLSQLRQGLDRAVALHRCTLIEAGLQTLTAAPRLSGSCSSAATATA